MTGTCCSLEIDMVVKYVYLFQLESQSMLLFIFTENKFYVGALLELSLELRTTQTTAVLLSVSEPEGYPALSLELNQGKVIISGDMGDRRPFRVEQSFQSEFAICDNKWHQIQAFYVEDKLTLKVDQFEQKYWLLDNGHITGARTHSPLYIGGLPGKYADLHTT